MALAILNRPCTSRFAAAVYASARRPYPDRRDFSSSTLRRDVDRNKAVEAATENIELSEPAAYLSTSTDPWFNLSYEDWLLRNSPRNQPTLFLYKNDPCVVIGRNQNPWQEATPRKLKEWGIPLVRRRSGGGTVFHDEGNTNFSIILPRLLFTRAHGANLVAKAVRERLGVELCTVNERNDVIIRDSAKGKDFKVSGSAYKIIQHRAYHHGTMLISSDLANLGKAIKSSSPNIQGKSVPSFRSPVTTINNYLPSSFPLITNETFVRAVVEEFASVYLNSSSSGSSSTSAPTFLNPQLINEEGAINEKILKGIEELKSWEWTYGQTPEFNNEIEADLSFGSVSASISARHALITTSSLHYTPPPTSSTDAEAKEEEHAIQRDLDQLALEMVGKRYESLEGVNLHLNDDTQGARKGRMEEVVRWLRSSM